MSWLTAALAAIAVLLQRGIAVRPMADKKNPADPKYEGAYKGKFTQDEIDAVYD